MRGLSVLILVVALSAVTAVSAAEIAPEPVVNPELTTATIERTLTYQASLKDNSGNPMPDNTYNITFRIYNVPVSGSALWNSGAVPVVTTGGNFSKELGPIPLPFNQPYYMSIQIAPDGEMTQRQKITMAAYAAVADSSNYAFRSDTSSIALSVPDNSITTAKISNNTILFNDIAQNGASSGQVMKWNGSSWAPRNDSVGTGGGGGWTDNNRYVTLSSNSDSVGIGLSTPTAKLQIQGTLKVYDKANIGPANSNAGSFSSVLGGNMHDVDGDYSLIGGGYHNTVGAAYGGICSGFSNKAGGPSPDSFVFIGGGADNYAMTNFATIGGGHQDTARAIYSGVFSGYDNRAGNSINDSGAFVGGGIHNKTYSPYSTISGGHNNLAGHFATVAGGDSNTADYVCTVGGGMRNHAGGSTSTVAGGANNNANAQWATIGGGEDNTVLSSASTISGGVGNSILAGTCAIPGGDRDTIESSGGNSMIFGYGVYCNSGRYVVFYDGLNHGQLSINRDGRDGLLNNPITVGTSSSNGNGAYLSQGGTWTNGSSRTFKENFTPFNSEELLSKIANLSVTTWNFKQSTEKHIGPVAEEFVGAFDTGVIRESDGKRDDMYLSSGDVAGVALAGVQELLKQNKELQDSNENMKQLILELERRVTELEKR
jgi:trimeric autotransporter adhesin